MNIEQSIRVSSYLFILGFLGVVSIVPLISQLLDLSPQPLVLPLIAIQIISVLQGAVFLLLMIWLGCVFSKKVGLTTPVITALARSQGVLKELKPQIIPALIGGIVGGLFLSLLLSAASPYLPAEYLSATETVAVSWYAKILYGGITEEILIRWGLMSFLVWAIYRLSQTNGSKIHSHNFVIAIILSSLVFGLAHLPALFALVPEVVPDVTIALLAFIVSGNAVFGFIAGYLYWKRGLECAMVAHIVAHTTLIIMANV